MSRRASFTLPALLLAVILLLMLSFPGLSESAIDPAADWVVHDLLDHECTSLNSEKLFAMLSDRFGPELQGEPSPELLSIMEGVIKRTDFDSISEEKTVKIIELVHWKPLTRVEWQLQEKQNLELSSGLRDAVKE
jgi:hypothetical protein